MRQICAEPDGVAPIVALVGTQVDCIETAECVSAQEGTQASKLRAATRASFTQDDLNGLSVLGYYETSAKTGVNVHATFDDIIYRTLFPAAAAAADAAAAAAAAELAPQGSPLGRIWKALRFRADSRPIVGQKAKQDGDKQSTSDAHRGFFSRVKSGVASFVGKFASSETKHEVVVLSGPVRGTLKHETHISVRTMSDRPLDMRCWCILAVSSSPDCHCVRCRRMTSLATGARFLSAQASARRI
jgi:hypothetical protein